MPAGGQFRNRVQAFAEHPLNIRFWTLKPTFTVTEPNRQFGLDAAIRTSPMKWYRLVGLTAD